MHSTFALGASSGRVIAGMIELYFTIVFAVIAVVEIFVGPRFWKFRTRPASRASAILK